MLQENQEKSSKIQVEKLDLITNNLVNSFELLQKKVSQVLWNKIIKAK